MNHQSPTTLAFINILDRYLEVSYVYWQRLQEYRGVADDGEDRLVRLIKLIESAEIAPQTAIGRDFKLLSSECAQGQSVALTEDLCEETGYYQKIILERLNNLSLSPKNISTLKNIMGASPQQFLSSFRTPTYAWDILTEVASLSFLPSSKKLAARDMIHMHAVELRQHLYRVIAQVKFHIPDSPIHIDSKFTIRQLKHINDKGILIQKLIENSYAGNITNLVNELLSYIGDTGMAREIVMEYKDDALAYMEQESSGYPDLIEHDIDIDKHAEIICSRMVIFGLAIGYSVWKAFVNRNDADRRILCKHCLFCTRTLLDEKRWQVCVKMGALFREIVIDLNEKFGKPDRRGGAYMIETNWFYARKQVKDQTVRKAVSEWDIKNGHLRYHFLQAILLDDFPSALEHAKCLLSPDGDICIPNMSLVEFQEWPILEDFRKSEYWPPLQEYANEMEQRYP